MQSLRKKLHRRRQVRLQQEGAFRGGNLTVDAAYQALRRFQYTHRQVKNFYHREETNEHFIYHFNKVGKIILNKTSKEISLEYFDLSTKRLEPVTDKNSYKCRFYSFFKSQLFYPFHNRKLSLSELMAHVVVGPWFEQKKYTLLERHDPNHPVYRIQQELKDFRNQSAKRQRLVDQSSRPLLQWQVKRLQRLKINRWHEKFFGKRVWHFNYRHDHISSGMYKFTASSVYNEKLNKMIKKHRSDLHLHFFFKQFRADLGEEWVNKLLKISPRQKITMDGLFKYSAVIESIPMKVIDALGGAVWSLIKTNFYGSSEDTDDLVCLSFDEPRAPSQKGPAITLADAITLFDAGKVRDVLASLPATAFQSETLKESWIKWPRLLKSQSVFGKHQQPESFDFYRYFAELILRAEEQKEKKKDKVSVETKYLLISSEIHAYLGVHFKDQDGKFIQHVEDPQWFKWMWYCLQKIDQHWQETKANVSSGQKIDPVDRMKFFREAGFWLMQMQETYQRQDWGNRNSDLWEEDKINVLLADIHQSRNIRGLSSTIKSWVQEFWLKQHLTPEAPAASGIKRQRL